MSLVTPLKRTAIIVRDMERSLRFYRDVLGMNVWLDGEAGAELPALYQLLGMPPCRTRWIILQSEDVAWGMVGLFELTDPAPDDDTHRNVDRVNRGESCLVFHTPDVDRVHDGAKAMGLTVLCPPTRLEIKAHGVVSREMTLRDPNGVLVNFIQNVLGGAKVGLSNRFPGIRGPARPRKRSVAVKVEARAEASSRAKPKRRALATPRGGPASRSRRARTR